MTNSKIDGRAVLSSRMHAIYEKFYSMENNKQLQIKYCNFLYRIYQKTIKNICLATGYEYIPNNRISLRDNKKFILNTMDIANTTAESRNGYDIYEIDKELSDKVSASLSEYPVLYQPIWSEYIQERNVYFIFDGSHRFLSLLDRANSGLYVPETLLVTLNRDRLMETSLEVFVPDCIYEVLNIFVGINNPEGLKRCVELYSFSFCGTKMYVMNIPYDVLKKVIVSWTMIIDFLYTCHRDNKIELTPAEMVHKNIFKEGQTTHELLY